MKNAKFTSIGLSFALLIGLSGSALVLGAAGQDRYRSRDGQYGGSLDARQHGYEHAYRDGADRGRQDRERRNNYSLRDNDYISGARAYEPAFGDKREYMQGYREGYKAGYEDGFNGRAGQYGQLYGRPADRRGPGQDDVYAARPHSATDMAFDAGYREGIAIGQEDQARDLRSNFRGNATYQRGDLGYRQSYGDRDGYRFQFRDGFERGYEDGFGRTRDFNTDARMPAPDRGRADGGGTGNRQDDRNYRNDQGNQNNRNDRNTPNTQQPQGGTFVVMGNRQWTPTGIRVNQGDVLRFTSTGEIAFTGANDRAGVAGSLAHKLVPGAPLPTAFAGALIGRIDNGLPFGIGNQNSITIPASGLLYLGTNDDNVSDNSGQFQVIIAR